jgi:hypothetical protein
VADELLCLEGCSDVQFVKLFTPDDLLRGLRFHELSPQERKVDLVTIADACRQADPQVRRLYAH